MTPSIQDRARLAGGADNRWEVTSLRFREKLSALVAELELDEDPACALAVVALFNGAALHAGGVPCASLSPVGLAFRLPPDEAAALIRAGRAMPLKYFAKSRVQKGWALFENPGPAAELEDYFLGAIAWAGKPG